MAGQDAFQQLVVAQKSDRGLKRQINEDACDYRIPRPGSGEARYGALFVVADGVGSIGSGDEASRTAIKAVIDTYYDPDLDDDDPRERLIAAVQDANDSVRARGRFIQAPTLGTTIVGVALFQSGQMYLFNVGDSRIYRLRHHALEQLTADQSAVDPRSTSERLKLTAYVGQPQPILPQILESNLKQGDTLVICTDGLWGLVDTAEIASVVDRNPPQVAVEQLVAKVYANGARDNVTVMLVQHGRRSGAGRKIILILVGLILIAVLGFALLRDRLPVLGPEMTPDATVESTPEIVADATDPALAENDDTNGLLVVRTPTVEANSSPE